MKRMEKPIDKETAKYNAVTEIAALLRESTKPVYRNTNEGFQVVHENVIFSPEEHETVKRAFLRLVSEL